jgi:curved DNA-binding protein CbpA
MKNYYTILEVNENASSEVIEKVYKVLAKKYHPDMNQGVEQKEAEEKFKDVLEAYDVLSNENKRAVYDKNLSLIKNENENDIKSKEIEYQRKAYNDAYLRALKNFKVKYIYPANFQEFLIDLFTVIFMIMIIVLVYQIPIFRDFIREVILNFN